MAVIEPAPMQANKNIGTITLVKLLTPKELDGKCDMFANRYPWETALKLFGAMPGKGAQEIK